MKKDQFCFSKNFLYFVLIALILGSMLYMFNYVNNNKLATNSKAAFNAGGPLSPTPTSAVQTAPSFTLSDLRLRAQAILTKLTTAKARSATMNTVSIQGQIDAVTQRLNLANSSFTNLSQLVTNTVTGLKSQLTGITQSKNTAQTAFETARSKYNQTVASFSTATTTLNQAKATLTTETTALNTAKSTLSQKTTTLGTAKTGMLTGISRIVNYLTLFVIPSIGVQGVGVSRTPVSVYPALLADLNSIKSRITVDTTNSFADEIVELKQISTDMQPSGPIHTAVGRSQKYPLIDPKNTDVMAFLNSIMPFDTAFTDFNLAAQDVAKKNSEYQTAFDAVTAAQTAVNNATTARDNAKIALDAKSVDLNTYKYLETLFNNNISTFTAIGTNLSENSKLPEALPSFNLPLGLNPSVYQTPVNTVGSYIQSYNAALGPAYDAYKNLDIAIIEAEANISTQVTSYTNYCSSIKPGTYYPILGMDELPLDKAQLYYNDYCGQNETGYAWNGIYGNYGHTTNGKLDGAMCYTATGLCSPTVDCKKIDCISRIGNGVACLNKPVLPTDLAKVNGAVTSTLGMDACAAKYKTRMGIDILKPNICPQNGSNMIGWYGGRGFFTNDASGIKKYTGSDTCLRLNAANSGPSSCNQAISDNYCGCADAGFTYVAVIVNGTTSYKNMNHDLYGQTALFRPLKSGAINPTLAPTTTTGAKYEQCPFSLVN